MDLMDDRAVVVSGAAEAKLPNGPEERPDFGSFFEEQHTALFRALWLVTRNRHEAEEVMQEAFLRVWERWDHVGSLSDPVGYLYRTAMNVFRSRARRAKAAIRLAVGHLPADNELARVEERDDVVRALAPSHPATEGRSRPHGSPRPHVGASREGSQDQGVDGSGARG